MLSSRFVSYHRGEAVERELKQLRVMVDSVLPKSLELESIDVVIGSLI